MDPGTRVKIWDWASVRGLLPSDPFCSLVAQLSLDAEWLDAEARWQRAPGFRGSSSGFRPTPPAEMVALART